MKTKHNTQEIKNSILVGLHCIENAVCVLMGYKNNILYSPPPPWGRGAKKAVEQFQNREQTRDIDNQPWNIWPTPETTIP